MAIIIVIAIISHHVVIIKKVNKGNYLSLHTDIPPVTPHQMTLSNIPGPDASAPLENSKITTNPSGSNDFPIPAYSSWFGFGGVHEIERRAFPEFFQEEGNIVKKASSD